MKISTGKYMDRPLISGGEWDSKVIHKVMETLHNGETHYVDVPGNADLRVRIGAYLSAVGISKGGEILITAGIQEARFLTVQVLGKALGKIALPQVMHPGVREVLALRDLDCVLMEVGTDQRMLVPPAAIRDLSAGVKVLFIESPSRLTGACYAIEELDEIVSLCKKYDISIIVDSGLHAWIESPCDSSAAGLEIDDSIFMIGEAWPGSGIDELYIGYILASEDMIKKIATQKQVISICTSAPSQNGAIAVGIDYMQQHPQIVAAMKKKRIVLESILIDMGAKIYSSPVVNFIVIESTPVFQKKLEAAKVRFIDSTYFGKPGLIQLPVSEQAIDALQ
ncbi:MAG: pyridoxal phosphate-dependent aminotransferase [Spirochaetaceae bacterium]|nr:MAG: pyridoxal phosphate-dependent aminotransferase [Spirochaetaceae bacterium]